MKATLITGASSGIGEGLARRFAADGHDLVLVARSEKKLHQLCDELMLEHQITAHYVVLDLAEPSSDLKLVEETDRHGITIDILINNAGVGSAGDFARLDLDTELRMIEVNVSALVALTHAYLNRMRKSGGGTIVNVSSAAGFQPIPYWATYAATKAFVTSFSEAIAEENRPFGIQVLAFCPGSTDTNFFAASGIDRPIKVKGQQTVDEVVEALIYAMQSGRTRYVPGMANKVGALLGSYVPSFLSRKLMASIQRPHYGPGNVQEGKTAPK